MSDNFDNRRLPEAFRYNETPVNLFIYEEDYALAHCISADFTLGEGIARSFNARYGTRADLRSTYGDNVLRFWQGKGFCLLSNDGHVFNLVVKGYEHQRASYQTLREALIDMRETAKKIGVEKIAMPRLCCGHEGLDWNKVHDIIFEVFDPTALEIRVAYLDEFIKGRVIEPDLEKQNFGKDRKNIDGNLSRRYY